MMLSSCGESANTEATTPDAENAVTDERGPNNGILLRDGEFVLELAIFETGVPPEYRAWATVNDQPVDPEDLDLNVQLTRLGGVVDDIDFVPTGDALRGDMVIYEPHSFSVSVAASYNGNTHRWSYDSFEGRTRIEPAVAEALGIETDIAGPAVIEETIPVYGRIVANSDDVSNVTARFDGKIETVAVALGDYVNAGDTLATIESNQSLTSFELLAPISGLITARNASGGESTAGRVLFTITDTSTVWADLAVFPSDLPRISVGERVTINTPLTDTPITGTIARILPETASNQAVTARVVLDNPDGVLRAGTWVQAQINIAEHEVPLAVRREGLQAFRNFTVVYAQIGDQYEVRMLDLGRQSAEWVEVLGGLEPGTRYVTENSYILKADVEKDGASHDH
ncbi:efflux RND transporter periplasmic adaptor subunit [Pseudohongiella sp. SYSU M77423]|uniref:efflux RND transporter periplasmic adaptor subunit n=1 Tax=Pseudohongiella sp. SYSU M77423 TaxID=3042312 RepID=UPI0024808A25|nr:efflux RND transporter periplasmic adaptor subunit [Pseudohongiella sp. SYSU M77423]MDH7945148.1 efflux RND transporter periplasmic adaptor subunit [Pseudohongiella sp. SYSU M77423]MEC8858812.1 efflux RND transporter periplasmic adaptor subunit [Pseudomonadota bacterium]|tara:strand:+ start:2874 stop:4070 length:1197 start_codon:yes stop_codon:yes gene_type:complete